MKRIITLQIERNMKHSLTIVLSLLLTLTMSAQSNITTFMGIPVDGTKESMTMKLLKNGVEKRGRDLMIDDVLGTSYFIRLMTNKGKVYRISMTEAKGTEDMNTIINKFYSIVEEYKENTQLYCELEPNHPVMAENDEIKKQYIKDGCYLAEFFQQADPQLYSRRIGIQITDKYGDYRIERLYDNVHNMPEDK